MIVNNKPLSLRLMIICCVGAIRLSGSSMSTTCPVIPEPGVESPPPNIESTFGVLFISTLICVGLIGITTLQAWLYFINYLEDRFFTRSMVAIVWSLEVVRCSFLVHSCYYYVIRGWGNPTALFAPTWSIANLPLMTNIVEMIVQLYFARRIWALARTTPVIRWVLTVLIVTLSLWTFGLGIAVYTIGLVAVSWTSYVDGSQKILAPFTLSVSMATNISIMLSLIFLLRRDKPQLPSSRAGHIIKMLTFYTVQAGALIVVVDAAVIALNVYVHVARVGFTYIGVFAMQGNLYANSLLASLNARSSLRASQGRIDVVNASNESSRRTAVSNRLFKIKNTPLRELVQASTSVATMANRRNLMSYMCFRPLTKYLSRKEIV